MNPGPLRDLVLITLLFVTHFGIPVAMAFWVCRRMEKKHGKDWYDHI